MEKVKTFLADDRVGVALWIGVSAGIMAICSFLLQMPELLPYYGVINFVIYAVKSTNDRRKK